MIEQIREKNRNRLVTATFRCKFLRAPSPAELSHWLAVFKADADFQWFLRQIAEAANSDQPLLGMATARVVLPTDMSTLDLASAKKQTGLDLLSVTDNTMPHFELPDELKELTPSAREIYFSLKQLNIGEIF